MTATATCDLTTLYHQTEDQFFSTTCPLQRRYCARVISYFTDEYAAPWNLLLVRVGRACRDDARVATLDQIRRTLLPVQVVVHEENAEQWGALLIGAGFQAAEKTTAMVLELSRFVPCVSECCSQISLTRNLDDWAAPLGSAFSILPEGVKHYQARHQRALDAGQSLYHFTLSMAGQVMSCLTLSISDAGARLNDVGTMAGYRGKGYGTRLIQAALLHASRLGAQRCFLEASEKGCSLYRALGFEPLFDYQSFTRGPIAGA